MTEPITRIADAGSATVLRGMVLRAQSISLGGRPRAQDKVVSHPRPTPEHVPSPVQTAQKDNPVPGPGETAEVRELARQQGYREGWEQGLQEGHETGAREGAAAARQDILAQAADVIAESASRAEQEAAQRVGTALEQEALQRWNQHQARLDALLAALPSQIAQRIDAAQDDLLALCMEALVQILGRDAVQPLAVRAAVQHAIHQIKARPLVRVELNPDDLAALQALPDWDAWCGQHAAGLQWTGSARIETGGCIVTSPEGSLDTRLDQQLQTFRSLLLSSREAAAQARSPATNPGGPT